MTATTTDADTVEREDLTHRLEQAGVDFSPDTSLEGLRGLANLLASDSSPSDEEAKPEPGGFGETAAGTTSEEQDAVSPPTKSGAVEPTASAGNPALFDTSEYRDPSLALPQIDGHDIDRIAIKFSGEIMLDRSDKDHVALWRRVKLGQKIELWVEAKGLGYEGKGATNKDGELDVIVAKRSVSVQHVRVLGPEDLKEAALEVASQARDAAENQDARDRLPSDA